MASGAKIKYAKLRLFKPSPSSKSKPAEGSQENGESPDTPSSNSVNRMEQEVIELLESDDEPVTEEPIVKRTRLDSIKKLEKPKPRLPKLPKKPPEGEGIISKFFKTSEDDFEPENKLSQAPKTKTKVQRKAAARKPRAPRKPKDQSDIRNAFQKYRNNDELINQLMLEHSVADRMDPEQLQLALAMSRSLADQQGVASLENLEPSASSSTTSLSSEERRLQGIRTTLEQYGFKCKNSYTDHDLNVIFGNNSAVPPKKVKRIKHRRPTSLVKRSPEELIAFMTQRAEDRLKEELHSEHKNSSAANRDARSYGSDVFWMSSNPEHTRNCLLDYYVEDLVEHTTVKMGYLLKDWHKIPGRERTPERISAPEVEDEIATDSLEPQTDGQEIVEDPEDSLLDMNTVPDEYHSRYNNEAPVHQKKCSPSPDLFASDSGEEDDAAGNAIHDGEVDKYVTAPETHAVADDDVEIVEPVISESLLCTSSENIFDDYDPIVDFDVYSSEEAKISVTGPARPDPSESSPCPSSPPPLPPENDLLPPTPPTIDGQTREEEEDVVMLLSSGESNGPMEQPHSVPPKRLSATAPDSGIPVKEQRIIRDGNPFPSPDRQLSFHALAIRERLSRVTLTDLETIPLEEDEPVLEDGGGGVQGNCSQESGENDVLLISDDEVNYSVRQEYSPFYNMSPLSTEENAHPENTNENLVQLDLATGHEEEDQNNTKIYFNEKEHDNSQTMEETPTEPPKCDVLSISSEEQSNNANEPQKADSTMAFLDGLIAKFDLPASSNGSTCDRPISRNSKFNDFVENCEVLDFQDETRTEVEKHDLLAPNTVISADTLDQEIEQVLSLAQQTCSQLPSKSVASSGKPLQRTKSDSVLLKQKKNPPQKSPSAVFQGRFQALMEQPESTLEQPVIEIRLEAISPQPDYSAMSSPLLHRELYKYGFKQLSRSKAVKILNHIYEQLHPFVELIAGEQSDAQAVPSMVEVERAIGHSGGVVNDRKELICGAVEVEKRVEWRGAFVPEMEHEEYILPSKPRKKTFWCPVPLNIAFHNMIQADPAFRQQILRYQPVDLDAIYSHLKEIGLRYESNDLIAFLDKRCITFRTMAKESQGSSGSRRKKTGN